MGTADNRSTRFEFKSAKQDANGLHVECIERGVYGSPPPARLIPDSAFAPEEMAMLTVVLTLLETKYCAIHEDAEKATDAATVNALMRQAEEAKAQAAAAKLETARIEAENVVRRAELEELSANIATIQAAVVEPPPGKTDA